MHGGELIDLNRLLLVLEEYGAAKAQEGSEASKAYEQLKRACTFRLGEKVFMRRDKDANEWAKGVVVAYMVHPPHFIIGAGDDRNKLPKRKKLLAVNEEWLAPRGPLPQDGKLVAWDEPISSGEGRGASPRTSPPTGSVEDSP